MIEVAAALLYCGPKFMICQRPAHKARGSLWEFPGGKLEPGETVQQALIRECREELAVTVQPLGLFDDVVFEYPDLTVHLTLLYASITGGELQRREHSSIRYITPQEITKYAFCPADTVFLEKLQAAPEACALRARLMALQEPAYRRFQCKLMPTIPESAVLGIRTPLLRSLARELAPTPAAGAFMHQLPHMYYEENNLHGFLIERIPRFDACIAALDSFLPYVDNWATCDSINPAVLKKQPDDLLEKIRKWIGSSHVYTVRFGLRMLMNHFLDGRFRPEYLELACTIRSEEYYIRMMAAWFFATALAKQYDAALPYLQQHRLPPWTHNKAIQKAVESRRISGEQKAYLRTLRIS